MASTIVENTTPEDMGRRGRRIRAVENCCGMRDGQRGCYFFGRGELLVWTFMCFV